MWPRQKKDALRVRTQAARGQDGNVVVTSHKYGDGTTSYTFLSSRIMSDKTSLYPSKWEQSKKYNTVQVDVNDQRSGTGQTQLFVSDGSGRVIDDERRVYERSNQRAQSTERSMNERQRTNEQIVKERTKCQGTNKQCQRTTNNEQSIRERTK